MEGIDFDNMSLGEQKKLESYMPLIQEEINNDKHIAWITKRMGEAVERSKTIIACISDGKMDIKRDENTNIILDKMEKEIESRVQSIINSHL